MHLVDMKKVKRDVCTKLHDFMYVYVLSPQPDCVFLSIWKHFGSLTKLWITKYPSLLHLPMIYQILLEVLEESQGNKNGKKQKQAMINISCFTSRVNNYSPTGTLRGQQACEGRDPDQSGIFQMRVWGECNTQNVPWDHEEQSDK